MHKLIQDVRRFVKPPYTIKDFFAVLGIAFVFLMVPITVLVSQQNNELNSRAALPPDGGSGRTPPCSWSLNGGKDGLPYIHYGDLNGDGRVSSNDAQWVLNLVAGLYPPQSTSVYETADVDDRDPPPTDLSKHWSRPSDVTAVDALTILNYVAYKINSFPACNTFL